MVRLKYKIIESIGVDGVDIGYALYQNTKKRFAFEATSIIELQIVS